MSKYTFIIKAEVVTFCRYAGYAQLYTVCYHKYRNFFYVLNILLVAVFDKFYSSILSQKLFQLSSDQVLIL
jgi:hypothetical protein